MKTLFICLWGQSRSKDFCERYTKNQFNAKFCSLEEHTGNRFDCDMEEWCDRIVFLEDQEKMKYYPELQVILNRAIAKGKQIINFPIEDEPYTFDEKFAQFQKLYADKEKDPNLHKFK